MHYDFRTKCSSYSKRTVWCQELRLRFLSVSHSPHLTPSLVSALSWLCHAFAKNGCFLSARVINTAAMTRPPRTGAFEVSHGENISPRFATLQRRRDLLIRIFKLEKLPVPTIVQPLEYTSNSKSLFFFKCLALFALHLISDAVYNITAFRGF